MILVFRAPPLADDIIDAMISIRPLFFGGAQAPSKAKY